MITTSGFLCRCAAIVVSVAFSANDCDAGQTPAADAIIARYVDARGGLPRITAIRTIIYRGVYREGAYTLDDAVLSLMRPYYKLVGDAEKPSRDFAEGYDGSAWEFYADPGIVLRTVGAASAAGRHAVYMDGPLLGHKERGWTVSVKGVTNIGDRKAYRLLVRMADGFEQEEFLDRETWLLIAERKVAAIHAFGRRVASELRFSDFRPVEGVLFPFSAREIEIATGRVLNEMRYTSITVNRALDLAAFSPPVFTRTPLQAFLEHLYAERADVGAVMWSYHDFRGAHPDLNTHEGVEFVGYQMLKMGDVCSAVELLKENAAEYPKAATAAFGLGRAYESAGRLETARAEFRRALTLDPQSKAAKQALEHKALLGPGLRNHSGSLRPGSSCAVAP